jgi:hypothetical protein
MRETAVAKTVSNDMRIQPGVSIEHGATAGCVSFEYSNTAYHADRRYVSSTGCKYLLRSPAHFRAYLDGPKAESTASQRLGSAVHCAFLEPDRFNAEYVQYSGERRGAEWKDFQSRNPTSEILTRTEFLAVTGMRDSLLSFKEFPLAELVRAGASEKSIFFEEEETGVLCKIRCDSVSPYLIVDLKTTDDARADAFARQAVRLQYDLQAAMYAECCRQFYGGRMPFYFVVVETRPPFGVMVHRAGDTVLEIGYRKLRTALERYQKARKENIWPSYQDPLSVLELPSWLNMGGGA